LIGYGRHFASVGDAERAVSYYAKARARGPGASLEQRNAFIAALLGLAGFVEPETLKSLAELTRTERDPRDAWALGNFGDVAILAGLFDDAISLSRDALSTMSYGAARLTLAAALYGKAAELIANGQRTEATRLVEEARSFGFSKASILDRYAGADPTVERLLPTLQGIVE
jgi:tetratricopeptide (TPR) repeat protein